MEEREASPDGRMGRAIVRGILIGIPVVLVVITLMVWLVTDNDIFDSMATAILPGILLGTFGGGFVGMAMTME